MDRPPLGLISNDPEAILISRRLAGAGKRVLHHAVAPAPRGAAETNLEWAATHADISIECEIIAISIDDTRLLRNIVLGTQDRPGLASELRAGTVIIDLGIRPPREAQALLGVLGMRGISLVDAAVMGGRVAMAEGTATVLAGGFSEAIDSAMPLLGELGKVERTGPLGSAQTAAALMGYVEAAHFAARSDAMSVGKALGLRPHALAHVLDEAPEQANIIRWRRRAEVVRTLVEDSGLGADIVDFNRLRTAEIATESS